MGIVRRIGAVVLMGVMICSLASCRSEATLKGTVEAELTPQYCEVQGKILESPIELGQVIGKGDVIAIIDSSGQGYALEQLNEVLAEKQASAAELKNGADPEALRQAENNVSIAEQGLKSAQTMYESAKKDYQRASQLFADGAVPKLTMDTAKDKADSAENSAAAAAAQADSARQQLILLQKGTSSERLIAAQSEVDRTQSQLNEMKENLEKYTIRAITDGTVISKYYELGDIVAPGYNLAELSSADKRYVVMYLPKQRLGEVEYGMAVTVRCGEDEYTGTVSYIDVKVQYTPKDMQSTENKDKESVKIKIKLPEDAAVKIGQDAVVVLPGKEN